MNTAYVQQPPAESGDLRLALLTGTGPASYSQTTGDVIYNPGACDYINFPMECQTVSGNYWLTATPITAGAIRGGAPSPTQSGWMWRWLYSGKNQTIGVDGVYIVTAGSGQTNGTYTATASAGGATISYTISGNALTSVKITNPGTIGFQYTGVPTFTIAAGGTPGTVTATLGFVADTEVATGTNLSAEVVQFGAIVSQL